MFKVGDKVRVVRDDFLPQYKSISRYIGTTGTVSHVQVFESNDWPITSVEFGVLPRCWFFPDELELVTDGQENG